MGVNRPGDTEMTSQHSGDNNPATMRERERERENVILHESFPGMRVREKENGKTS